MFSENISNIYQTHLTHNTCDKHHFNSHSYFVLNNSFNFGSSFLSCFWEGIWSTQKTDPTIPFYLIKQMTYCSSILHNKFCNTHNTPSFSCCSNCQLTPVAFMCTMVKYRVSAATKEFLKTLHTQTHTHTC